MNLTGWSQPARVRFYNIAPNYFALLGVKPQLGRSFNPEDHTPGFTLEVLLSDGLWKRDFAGDPGIVGKSLRLDNDLYQVIGVMPPGYQDPGRTADERHIELWAASGFAGPPAPVPQRDLRILPETIARIKSGLTIAQAQVRVDALVAALQKQFPVEYPSPNSRKVRLVPLKENVVGNARQTLILLLGAVGLVLLIGCVNVANLQLARASVRGREMAIRQALGASRARLVRQLLIESLLLAFLGGIAGLGILFVAKPFLLRMVPESMPQLNAVSINWTVLIFALASSLVAGAIFGLAPALHAGRFDLTTALKEGARGTSDSGEQAQVRRVLVVTEFALSLVLMIAAGLLLRSFADLLKVPPGFNPQKVMALRMWLPVPNDPETDIYRKIEQEAPFLREIVRRGKTVPGVQEIALADMAAVPLAHARTDLNPYKLMLEGSATPSNQAPLVDESVVTPGYFHLLGITLLRGRFFSDSDDEKAAPVAVINDAFARTYLPAGDALGKHFKLNRVRGGSTSDAWFTVVGVVADARTESLAEAGVPQIYLSLYQRRAKDLAILLRGQLDAAATPVACGPGASCESGTACFRGANAGRCGVRVSFRAALFDGDRGAIRSDGFAAGDAGDLWSDVVHRECADARDRDSRGARRAEPERFAHGAARGIYAGDCGGGGGAGWRARNFAFDGGTALRRAADGSFHVRRRSASADSRGPAGVLFSGPAGDPRGSADGSAAGIDEAAVHVVVRFVTAVSLWPRLRRRGF